MAIALVYNGVDIVRRYRANWINTPRRRKSRQVAATIGKGKGRENRSGAFGERFLSLWGNVGSKSKRFEGLGGFHGMCEKLLCRATFSA